jgi:hypothetical protein
VPPGGEGEGLYFPPVSEAVKRAGQPGCALSRTGYFAGANVIAASTYY